MGQAHYMNDGAPLKRKTTMAFTTGMAFLCNKICVMSCQIKWMANNAVHGLTIETRAKRVISPCLNI